MEGTGAALYSTGGSTSKLAHASTTPRLDIPCGPAYARTVHPRLSRNQSGQLFLPTLPRLTRAAKADCILLHQIARRRADRPSLAVCDKPEVERCTHPRAQHWSGRYGFERNVGQSCGAFPRFFGALSCIM
ncbi:hypothetical protein BD311DRAFT_124675 [Dichomitus squalens]|uniref:Uncharacterized protein n=1 Tax=Dichomitus squalens TaxID=114155 RepID=A0A4Q9MAU9_9APHY|nr:hypothetical protein BD311DRAFT_124675 [Dichomitus squalens]